MATPYETIYNRALAKCTDYELAEMSDYDLEEMLHGWLMSAVAKFRKCKSDLKDRDEELAQFNEDLEEEEIEILSIMLVREWIQPKLNSVLLTNQFIGDKESKFYSQSAHLTELQALDNRLRIEAQKLSRDYSYANSDYFSD